MYVALLLVAAMILKYASMQSDWIENSYASQYYPKISVALRKAFGTLPFSIGDVLYLLTLTLFTWWFVTQIKTTIKNKDKSPIIFNFIYISILTLLSIYTLFNVLWGLNYNRKGIAWQLQLEVKDYQLAELKHLDSIMREKACFYKNRIDNKRTEKRGFQELIQEAYRCYDSARSEHPYFFEGPVAVKPVLFSKIVAHLGFIGHYNPFTGEAQVNTDIPAFSLPYTMCHEIAHQLGYAKENEANFVAFIAAEHSRDPAFSYSAYLDLYLYSNQELYRLDAAAARKSRDLLSRGVQSDIEVLKNYERTHRSPIEAFARNFYNQFLKLNEQPSGLQSYNRVVLWLLAYYRKTGTI